MQASEFIAERRSYGESEGDFSWWTAGCRFKAEVAFLGVDVPALLSLSVSIHRVTRLLLKLDDWAGIRTTSAASLPIMYVHS